MVRRADDEGIDRLVVDQTAKITVAPRWLSLVLGGQLQPGGQAIRIDVGDGHDFGRGIAREGVDQCPSPPAGPHHAHPHPLAGRRLHRTQHSRTRRCGGGGAGQKPSSRRCHHTPRMGELINRDRFLGRVSGRTKIRRTDKMRGQSHWARSNILPSHQFFAPLLCLQQHRHALSRQPSIPSHHCHDLSRVVSGLSIITIISKSMKVGRPRRRAPLPSRRSHEAGHGVSGDS